MTAPGWYPDPSDPSRQRYFDGRAWTDQFAPLGIPTPNVAQPQAAQGMSNGLKIGLGVGAAFLALVALGSIGDNDKPKPSTSSSRSASIGSTVAAPTTTESGFTPAQDNAIKKAESYLDTSAFSKTGLVNQLVRGSKFSEADATFAVEYIEKSGGVDWNEQAVRKAKSYLDTSAFSLEGLINQLERGSKFTPAQAQYGANKAYSG